MTLPLASDPHRADVSAGGDDRREPQGTDNNILTQIGLVVLIGLAAKNAILIVEFARQAEEKLGMSAGEAAAHAARRRLRPHPDDLRCVRRRCGAARVRHAAPGQKCGKPLGIAVFAGMIGVTVFGLVFTPVFYVVCRKLVGLGARWKAQHLARSQH